MTQNNKFAIRLQYLKKEVGNEVDFSHSDKHESFLEISTMMVKHFQSSQNSKLAMSLQHIKNKIRD